MPIFAEITENEYINQRHPRVRGDNLTNSVRYNSKTVRAKM